MLEKVCFEAPIKCLKCTRYEIKCLKKNKVKDGKLQDYDLHEAPQSANGGPLLIEASINLSNILEVERDWLF